VRTDEEATVRDTGALPTETNVSYVFCMMQSRKQFHMICFYLYLYNYFTLSLSTVEEAKVRDNFILFFRDSCLACISHDLKPVKDAHYMFVFILVQILRAEFEYVLMKKQNCDLLALCLQRVMSRM
jgi:hypothetical protein